MADATLDPSLAIPNTPNFINPAYSTPEQRKQLYAYAQQLMAPQPVQHWAQGLGEMARALMGGWTAHQADVLGSNAYSQAAKEDPRGALESPASPGGGMPDQGGAPPSPVGGGQDTGLPDPGAVLAYTQQSAAARGIDPKVAAAFVQQESSGRANAIGDDGSSFGPAQLHYGGIAKTAPHPGLGDAFTQATGLDARDPSTWKQQVDFGLDQAKKGGWSPWATTRDKLGLSNFTGIGGAAGSPQVDANGAPVLTVGRNGPSPIPAPATAASIPPAHAALAQALLGPRGGNGLPVSAAQINAYMNDPNVSDNQKILAQEMVAPKAFTGATGNVGLSYQNQPVGAPIFRGGVLQQQGTSSTPSIVGGEPNAPTNLMVPPVVGGQNPAPGGPPTDPASAFGPNGVLGQMRTAQAATEGQAGAIKNLGEQGGVQFASDQQAASNYQQRINPLIQAIPRLEALNKTGTGPGTAERNQIVSFLQSLGIPGFSADSIQNFDEAKKYLTDYVNQTGNTGTNDKLAAAFAGNPSVEISNAAAIDVAKTALSLQRLKQAQVVSFQHSGATPAAYGGYALNFANSVDPRAFGIDLMSPEAKRSLDAEMPKGSPARAKFLQSLKIAQDAGVLSR